VTFAVLLSISAIGFPSPRREAGFGELVLDQLVIACAPSLEELRQKLPGVIQDLIEFNKPEWIGHNIAVEIVAIARERIDIAA
jgi:hypothetical protein